MRIDETEANSFVFIYIKAKNYSCLRLENESAFASINNLNSVESAVKEFES